MEIGASRSTPWSMAASQASSTGSSLPTRASAAAGGSRSASLAVPLAEVLELGLEPLERVSRYSSRSRSTEPGDLLPELVVGLDQQRFLVGLERIVDRSLGGVGGPDAGRRRPRRTVAHRQTWGRSSSVGLVLVDDLGVDDLVVVGRSEVAAEPPPCGVAAIGSAWAACS